LSPGLYILSFPNWNLSWLAWIALAPLSLISRFSSPRSSFFYGWLAGTLAYTGILIWLIDTFRAAGQSIALATLCLVALSAYLGLFWGTWSIALSYYSSGPGPETLYKRSIGPGLALFGAAAWVALEYLRTHLFSGFPWALLADTQVHHLPVIQIASFTGSYGVSFSIVFINLLLNALLGTVPTAHHIRPWGLSLQVRYIALIGFLFTFGLLGFGYWSLSRPFPSDSPVSVALLQGNIDQYKKWDQTYVDEIKIRYTDLVMQASSAKPDLIIWPETSVPGYLLQEPKLQEWLVQLIRKSGTNHLIGSPHYENKNSYNSAFSINHEGQVEGQYAKKHLVPFGEVVPWSSVLGQWVPVLNQLGGFTAGHWSPVLAGRLKAGVNICYEAIFPDLVRRSVKEGAEVIVNLTNDGWYMKTAAPYQHLAPNVFRAIENRRWVLRANNTGISAIIDPFGRIQQASNIFEPALVHGTIQPLSAQTPYTRFGDVFAWLCLAIFAFVLGARAILRRTCSPNP